MQTLVSKSTLFQETRTAEDSAPEPGQAPAVRGEVGCEPESLADDCAGSVSVEVALSIGVLVVFVSLLVGALAAVAAYISVIDTAGAAARAASLGLEYTPERGSVTTFEEGEFIRAVATINAGLMEVSYEAKFPREFVE